MKWIPWVVLIVSLGGFLDASFLTVQHYTSGEITCSVTHGCDEVLSSKYATIAGIPTSLTGVVYYLFMMVMMIIYLDTRRKNILRLAALTTTVGFVVSLGFVYLQAFVLEAWCQYCLVSAGTSTLLFIFGMIIVLNKKFFRSQ